MQPTPILNGGIIEITNISFTALEGKTSRRLALKFRASSSASEKFSSTAGCRGNNVVGGGWTGIHMAEERRASESHADPVTPRNECSFDVYLPPNNSDILLSPIASQRRLLLPLLTCPSGIDAVEPQQKNFQCIVLVEKQHVEKGTSIVNHQREINLAHGNPASKHTLKAGSGTAVVTCTVQLHHAASLEGVESLDRELQFLLSQDGKVNFPKTWKAADTIHQMLSKLVKQLASDKTAPRPASTFEALVGYTSVLVHALQVLQRQQASTSSSAEWAAAMQWIPSKFSTACSALHQQHHLKSFLRVSTNDLNTLLAEAAKEWNPRIARFRVRLSKRAETNGLSAKSDDVAEKVQSDARLKFIDGAKDVFSGIGTTVSTLASGTFSSDESDATSLTDSLSNCGGIVGDFLGTLTDVTNVLGPLVQALPFGEALVNLLSTMYKCFASRRELLEQSEKITTQLSMLISVLLQPAVQKLIQADAATNSVLEDLFSCVDECCEMMENYCESNPVYQFFAASRVAQDIDDRTVLIASYLDRLHHLVSLRTLAHLQENAATVNRSLAAQSEMLMCASSSIEALAVAVKQQQTQGNDGINELQTQLLHHIQSSESRTAALIQQISSTQNPADEWRKHSTTEIASIVNNATEATIRRHIDELQAGDAINTAAMQAVLDDVLSKVSLLSGSRDGSTAATDTIIELRDYVTTELIPSMLMEIDGKQIDQHDALKQIHEALLEKFSHACEKSCVEMEQRLNSVSSGHHQETMSELHQILANIRSSATTQDSLVEALADIRGQVASSEKAMSESLAVCIRDSISKSTEANEALHTMTMGRFDAILQSVSKLGTSADQQAELLLGRMSNCIKDTVTEVLETIKKGSNAGEAASDVNNQGFKAWAEAQKTLQSLQGAKMDSLQEQANEILSSLQATSTTQMSFAATLQQMCSTLGSSATSLLGVEKTVNQLSKLVEQTHTTMLEKFKQQQQILESIQRNAQVSANSIDTALKGLPVELRSQLTTEFQDLRKEMSNNQGAANEDMKKMVCERIDDMFQKLYLSDVTEQMLKQHLDAVKASCKVVLGDDVLQQISETVKGSMSMVVHDLHKGASSFQVQLEHAISQCEVVVARATKSATIEVFEQLGKSHQDAADAITNAVTASQDNVNSVIRTLTEALEGRLTHQLKEIHKTLQEVLRNVSQRPNDLKFNAVHDFDGITSKKCLAKCAKFSVPAVRAELRAAYCKKFQHYRSAVSSSMLHADIMFTTLRMMKIPEGTTAKERAAAEDLDGSTFDSSEIVQAMKAFDQHLLLVEGRAGIGKTSFAMQLCRLQNFFEGFTILITLSDLVNYVKGKNRNMSAKEGESYRLSLRELIYMSLLDVDSADRCLLGTAAVDLIFYNGAPILWIVDGLDEVQLNNDPFIKEFLNSFTTIVGRAQHPVTKHRKEDLVLLTSREERSGNYCYDDIPIMSINPWTLVEVNEFANKFFQQDDVIKISQERESPGRIKAAMKTLSETIVSGQLGPFATLPIITEMLCWKFASDPNPADLKNLNAAILYKDSLTNLYERDVKNDNRNVAGNIPYTTIEALCIKFATSALTSGLLEFNLDLNDRVHSNLFHCGLVRKVIVAGNTATVRFAHKSIMEYFAAIHVAANLQLLNEIKSMPFPILPPPAKATNEDAARRVEFITFVHSTDFIRVNIAQDVKSEMTIKVECDQKEGAFDVLWFPEADLKSYHDKLKSSFSRPSSNDPFSKAKWSPAAKEYNRKRTTLTKGKYYFVVRSSGNDTRPHAVLVTLEATSKTVDLRRDVSLTHEASFADILEDKQQRNFFCLLAMLVGNGTQASKDLTAFVIQRFNYHLTRTLPLFDKRDLADVDAAANASRVVSDRIVKSFARNDGKRVEFLRKRCGMDLLVELSQLSQGTDYQTALSQLTVSSTFFGKLLETVGLKGQTFWKWMIVPCARYGAVGMLKFVETTKLSSAELVVLRQSSEYREALVQAAMHRHKNVKEYLHSIPIKLDLNVACKVGADEAVSEVLEEHKGASSMLLEAIKAALDARQFSVVQLVLRIGQKHHTIEPIKVTALIVEHYVAHQESPSVVMLRYSLVQIIRGSPEPLRLALLAALSDRYYEIKSWAELVKDPDFRTELTTAMRSHFGALLLALRLNNMWLSKIVSPKWMLDAKQSQHGPFIAMLAAGKIESGGNVAHLCLGSSDLQDFAHELAELAKTNNSLKALFAAQDGQGLTPLAVALQNAKPGAAFSDAVSLTTKLAHLVGLEKDHPTLVLQSAPSISDLLHAVDNMIIISPDVKGIMKQLLPVLLAPFSAAKSSPHRIGPQHMDIVLNSQLHKKVFKSSLVEGDDKDLETFLVVLVFTASLQQAILSRDKIVSALRHFKDAQSLEGSKGEPLRAAFDAVLRPVDASLVSSSCWQAAFPLIGGLVLPALDDKVAEYIATSVLPQLVTGPGLSPPVKNRALSVLVALGRPIVGMTLEGKTLSNTELVGCAFRDCDLRTAAIERANVNAGSIHYSKIHDLKFAECTSGMPIFGGAAKHWSMCAVLHPIFRRSPLVLSISDAGHICAKRGQSWVSVVQPLEPAGAIAPMIAATLAEISPKLSLLCVISLVRDGLTLRVIDHAGFSIATTVTVADKLDSVTNLHISITPRTEGMKSAALRVVAQRGSEAASVLLWDVVIQPPSADWDPVSLIPLEVTVSAAPCVVRTNRATHCCEFAGHRLLIGSSDGNIHVADSLLGGVTSRTSLAITATHKLHEESIASLSLFNSAGDTWKVLTSSKDGTVKILSFNSSTGHLDKGLSFPLPTESKHELTAACWAARGEAFVTSCEVNGYLTVWEAKLNAASKPIEIATHRVHTKPATSLRSSPDGLSFFCCSGDGQGSLFIDASQLTIPLAKDDPKGATIVACGRSAANTHFMAMWSDGQVKFWDLTTLTELPFTASLSPPPQVSELKGYAIPFVNNTKAQFHFSQQGKLTDRMGEYQIKPTRSNKAVELLRCPKSHPREPLLRTVVHHPGAAFAAALNEGTPQTIPM